MVDGIKASDGETFSYKILFKGFKIEQYSGKVNTLVINPIDTLYVEQIGIGLPA